MDPAVGRYVPEMTLISVVLPEPLGPINPRISPCCKAKLTSSRARKPPKFFVMRSIRNIGPPVLVCGTMRCCSRADCSGAFVETAPSIPARCFFQFFRRSSISKNEIIPSRFQNMTAIIAAPVPIMLRPWIWGRSKGPITGPSPILRNTSMTMVIKKAPTTAPETVLMPPTISIAIKLKVSPR